MRDRTLTLDHHTRAAIQQLRRVLSWTGHARGFLSSRTPSNPARLRLRRAVSTAGCAPQGSPGTASRCGAILRVGGLLLSADDRKRPKGGAYLRRLRIDGDVRLNPPSGRTEVPGHLGERP